MKRSWARATLLSGVTLLSEAGLGCAGAASRPPTGEFELAPAVEPSPPLPAEPSLPPLTVDEQQLERELRQLVGQLGELGPRSVEQPLELAEATDWVFQTLTEWGLSVSRQGFAYQDEVLQNLIVHNPGLRRGDHHVVVGARLDTPSKAGGADDNASGVAALMCLAKRFAGRRALRSVDFVWFTDAALRAPGASGAVPFIAGSKKDDLTITAMVELHGLGVFNDAPNSQAEGADVVGAGSVASFIGVVGYPQHAVVSDHFFDALSASASLPVKRFTALSDGAPVPSALHLDFVAEGYPGILVFDTHKLRYPQFGSAEDVAEQLDYERMARVVAGLEQAVWALSGPQGQAPLPNQPNGVSQPE